VVLAVRADEAHHRDVNHGFANELGGLAVGKMADCPPHAVERSSLRTAPPPRSGICLRNLQLPVVLTVLMHGAGLLTLARILRIEAREEAAEDIKGGVAPWCRCDCRSGVGTVCPCMGWKSGPRLSTTMASVR
jgi:hypothetical protein